MKTLEFFWDPASPYTYLASTQIEALAARTGVQLVWKPFVLGAVFKAAGNQAPATIPAKGKHLFRDVMEWGQFYNVPVTMPNSFPVNGISALRCALVAQRSGKGGEFAKAVMHAHWGEGLDVSSPEVLASVCAKVGLDGPATLAATQDQDIKDELKANTEDAVARGAFGAPTMFVGTQMYWGNDRLQLLEWRLGQG